MGTGRVTTTNASNERVCFVNIFTKVTATVKTLNVSTRICGKCHKPVLPDKRDITKLIKCLFMQLPMYFLLVFPDL